MWNRIRGDEQRWGLVHAVKEIVFQSSCMASSPTGDHDDIWQAYP